MVAIVLSNTLGQKLRIATLCTPLTTSNRLHGIGQEVYSEGTHLMVPLTSYCISSIRVILTPESDSLA